MALTAAQQTDVFKLGVGLFGAAVGATYLNAIGSYIDGGGTIAGAYKLIVNDPFAATLYGPGLTNQQAAANFVNNLVGNAATQAAKDEGVALVKGLLDGGSARDVVFKQVIDLLDQVAYTDAKWGAASQQLDNRVAVSQYYSTTLAGTATTLSALQAIETNVVATSNVSTPAAMDALIRGATAATNLTLDQDNLVGTSGNDTFLANVLQDNFGTSKPSLQSFDTITGGDGTDVLSVTLTGAANAAPTLKAVETVNVRFTGADTLDMANATGTTSVNVANSTTSGTVNTVGTIAALGVMNQNQDATFNGSKATALGLNIDTVGTATALNNVTVNTTATSEALTLNNAYVKTAGDATAVTSTIAATGTNVVWLNGNAATLTSVTVTGAGSLDLTNTTLTGALTKFDASASTGAIKVGVNSTKAVAISTGSGNDTVLASAQAVAGSSAALGAGNDQLAVGGMLAMFDKGANGGDGTDTINITDGATLTATTTKYITNFEQLDVSGGKGTYDLSLNAGLVTVQANEAINGALAAAVTLTNVPATSAFNIISKAKTGADYTLGQMVTFTIKASADTTADTLTLNATFNDGNANNAANGNIDATAGVTADKYETLVLNTAIGTTDGGTTGAKDSAYTFKVKLVDADATTLTVTGAGSVDTSSVTTIGKVAKVDASAATGNVTVDLTTQANGVNYLGSAGVDTYKASAKGDNIYTGKGADVVTVQSAAVRDTLVYKAASDSQLTDTTKDGKITVADAGADNINGFKNGGATTDDLIDLTNFAFTGAQRGVVDVSAKVLATTDLTSVTGLFTDVAGNRGVATSYIGADTYVMVDVNKDGNFTAADDLIVKFVATASITLSDLGM